MRNIDDKIVAFFWQGRRENGPLVIRAVCRFYDVRHQDAKPDALGLIGVNDDLAVDHFGAAALREGRAVNRSLEF